MKKTLVILAALLASCGPEPLAHVDSGNADLRVLLVGHIPEHACDIYLLDRRAYAVVCPDAGSETTTRTGKTTTSATVVEAAP